MPTNLPPEYSEAKTKYENADTIQEKIKHTEEMISKCPKHKGAENLLKNLKKRLKKLKEKKKKQEETQKGGYSIGVEKQGFQVCITGYPNTGKSTLLKKLTNADPEIAKYPHTTEEPQVAMMNYEGAQIQLVDLPPIKENAAEKQGEIMSIIKNTDGLILMLGKNPKEEKKTIKKELKKIDAEKPTLTVKKGQIPSKEKILNFFNLIRVYTKEPGEEPDKENPLVLEKGSTVEEAGEQIHKDFARNMKYVRVWGSGQFDGQRVEKDHILEDEDVVEFHTK